MLVDIWEGTEPRPEVDRFCEMWGIKGPILLDPDDGARHRRVREHELERTSRDAATAARFQLPPSLAEVETGERVRAPEVALAQLVGREIVREEPAGERCPDDRTEPMSLRAGEELLLVLAD